MEREILISQDANEKQVAILEEGRLEEFYIERGDSKKLFGNIYEGVVKTIVPGIDAAFVDIGTGKDGFLYVGDALRSPLDLDADFDDEDEKKTSDNTGEVKPQVAAQAEGFHSSPVAAPEQSQGQALHQGQGSAQGQGTSQAQGRFQGRQGRGRGRQGGRQGGRFQSPQHHHSFQRRPRIEEVLKVGQKIIVQVVKEPLGNKGPRLTTQFSIPARYLVMMPGNRRSAFRGAWKTARNARGSGGFSGASRFRKGSGSSSAPTPKGKAKPSLCATSGIF